MATMIISLIIIIMLLKFISFPVTYGQYDYMVMAFEWGPAYCRKTPCLNNPVKNNFTIHGLWPSTLSEPQPFECIPSDPQARQLNVGKLPPKLVNNLHQSWPSYQHKMDEIFWEIEWYKHGTCSYNDYKQNDYFYLAFNLWNRMRLFDILGIDNIVPVPDSSTKTYYRSEVEKAIKNHHFNGQVAIIPEFHCNVNKNPHELIEIRMCLNLHADYINCTKTGSCGASFAWHT